MNIFVLDKCPVKSAAMLCDKHIVKMPLESAQMLSSVWHRYGHGDKVKYKEAFKNHPCTLWAGDSSENYIWLYRHAYQLCFEYTKRYHKIHGCQRIIMDLRFVNTPFDFIRMEQTDHPQCMPDQYKDFSEDAVSAYRKYYIGEKSKIAKWRTGFSRPPLWYLRETYDDN
mgnify:CR=1 FL=1|jgi:hypothetical protein